MAMKKYHVIASAWYAYDFELELPDTLTEEERDEQIMDYLSDHKDECYRDDGEEIDAIDDITDLVR